MNFEMKGSCLSILEKIKDPKYVSSIQLSNQVENLSPPWLPLSLSHGYPSLLLLFSVLEQTGDGKNWDEISHRYVLQIKDEIERHNIEYDSLFEGLAGVCFSLHAASRNRTRYTKMLERLEEVLLSRVRQKYFPEIDEKLALGIPQLPRHYDIISGISGIGLYAINSHQDDLLYECLERVILLTQEIEIKKKRIPGWYVPNHYLNDVEKKAYPKGNYNVGIAHGISGILGFLSIAKLSGIEHDTLHESIDRVAQWLSKQLVRCGEEVFWCVRSSYEEEVHPADRSIRREGWCDGNGGVARILYLAGKAVGNNRYQEIALNAFLASLRKVACVDKFSSPTFCHGYSGFLSLAKLMYLDTDNCEVKEAIPLLEEKVLSYFQDEYPYGFQDNEMVSDNILQRDSYIFDEPLENIIRRIPLRFSNNAGLLGGVVGIILSLISRDKDDFNWAWPMAITESRHE